jgi:hypothetical protein
MKFAQAADVIDVRVGAHDRFHNEPVAPDQVQDARDFVAGVNHQRFEGDRIADDGTVALQHPYGDGDMDHSVRGGIQGRSAVVHEGDYIIGDEGILGRRRMVCGAR